MSKELDEAKATGRFFQDNATKIEEAALMLELAAEAGLSVFHFARMFKQTVGVPPRVYLTQLRMEKAGELLQSTELSITDIAQEVGYSSSQVLARPGQKVADFAVQVLAVQGAVFGDKDLALPINRDAGHQAGLAVA